MNIIELIEVSPNRWRAKYKGNYGIYTIKLNYKGKQLSDFSCSCPSNSYRCKHISMIEQEINEYIENKSKSSDRDIKALINELTFDELSSFIQKQIQNWKTLEDSLYYEFAHKIKQDINSINKYSAIMQKALKKLDDKFTFFKMNGYFEEDDDCCVEIEDFDIWYEIARKNIQDGNYDEAILVCKACIEEYTDWQDKHSYEEMEYVSSKYTDEPFIILEEGTEKFSERYLRDLLEYSKSEIVKPKYQKTDVILYFNEFLMKLCVSLKTDDFLHLQDKLWNDVDFKLNTGPAESILQTKIDFFNKIEQPDKAWTIIKENLQIETFRTLWINKLIEENNFEEAKILVKESIQDSKGYFNNKWIKIQLKIAQKENDIPEIRRISFSFINDSFEEHYYTIYKASFTKEEWQIEVEKIISHYEKKNTHRTCSRSLLKVLKDEGQKEKIIEYVKSYPCYDIIMEYHLAFSDKYPEIALSLLKKIIDDYAAANTGESHYHKIAAALKKMLEIEGGNKVVTEMKENYKVLYKQRRRMLAVIE